MRLEGKVALITGAAAGVQGEVKGFGGAAAWLFAEEGAKVVLTDILEEQGRQAEAQLREQGYDVVFARHDVIKRSRLGGRNQAYNRYLWQTRHTGE